MLRRRKIAIVLPDLRGGGAERLHINLASAWLHAGFDVDFVLLRAHGELMHLLPEGASVRELGVARMRSAVPALRRYLRAARPDVTLVAMWPLTCIGVVAWLASACRGRLFLSDHTQLSVACLEETSTNLATLGLSIRLTYPLASGVVAVSKGVRDDLCQLGGLSTAHVEVVYNPAAIDPGEAPQTTAEADALWGRSGGFRILTVGTLKPQKDHATLLHAMAQLPETVDAMLVVLGDGPLRAQLTDLANELGVSHRVMFRGFVDDPTPWLRTADLFVLSSRWEGFANVVVEALSFGVPVVSTNCPSGPSEILEDGRFGDLIPVADPASLSRAILASREKAWDRAALMERARHFSVSTIAQRYLQVMGLEG
ncbi:MAG: glycosyltransferase [Polyangiaceae bacterium]|nr:glycosyltransferase [Polyangiaceae bacterium]